MALRFAQESSSGAGNVQLVSRVGIRLYLSIGPGGAPASNFILGTLQLTSGPGGVSAGPFPASSVVTIAPRAVRR